MSVTLLTELELSRLPLFPLPGAVLLPGAVMPLHVFEPRYRALVKAVLSEGGAMGIAMLKEEEGAEQTEPTELDAEPPALPSRPCIYRVAGAGRIIRHVELPEGRFMILLRGEVRVALDHELETDEPFRRFVTHELAEEPMHEPAAAGAMAAMQDCLRKLAPAIEEGGPQLLDLAARARHAGELADILASAFVAPREQQALLETLRVNERVPIVVSALGALLLGLPREHDEKAN